MVFEFSLTKGICLDYYCLLVPIVFLELQLFIVFLFCWFILFIWSRFQYQPSLFETCHYNEFACHDLLLKHCHWGMLAFAKLLQKLKLVLLLLTILLVGLLYSVQYNVWIVFTLVRLTGCVNLFQDWARNRFGDRSCSYKRRRSWLSLVSSTPYCYFEFMAPVSLVKVITCL